MMPVCVALTMSVGIKVREGHQLVSRIIRQQRWHQAEWLERAVAVTEKNGDPIVSRGRQIQLAVTIEIADQHVVVRRRKEHWTGGILDRSGEATVAMSKENRHGTGTPHDSGNIEFSITIEIADSEGLYRTGRGLGSSFRSVQAPCPTTVESNWLVVVDPAPARANLPSPLKSPATIAEQQAQTAPGLVQS